MNEYNNDMSKITRQISAELNKAGIQNLPVIRRRENEAWEFHIEIPLSQWNITGYAEINQQELETLNDNE